MSRMPLKMSVGALLVAICVPASSVHAQTPAQVRVINGPAPIQRWLNGPATEVLREVETGTTLDVLERDMDWFWVIAPPDIHGTRKPGWIRASHVEPVVARAAAMTPVPDHSAERAGPAGVPPAEDKVTITEKRDEAAAAPAKPTSGRPAFEDLHFDRDGSVLRPEDMELLQAAVSALKDDPSLVVNITGYTCSLGTTAHNQVLGVRRANAVKDYLVSQGIAADRLHTRSQGESDARHDNAHEDTRRLNRRVALVADDQR